MTISLPINPLHIPERTIQVCLLLLLLQGTPAVLAATLTAYATLPADTFVPGPTSGQFIEPANGRQPPFAHQQPVQGFSALVQEQNGTYLVLSDNGFGTRSNSSDYILSIYQIESDFRRSNGGSGVIRLKKITRLSDPEHLMPYEIVNLSGRLLTGADLDPESLQLASDGSYWIGEEFIPAILHFNAEGVLLAPPFKLDGLSSADNPTGESATLPRSRGFEGMAISADGKWLYPMLEAALLGTKPGLNIYAFDIEKQRFVSPDANTPAYRYRLDEGSTAIGEFTLYTNTTGLVIERDSNQGPNAVIKKVYRVDFESQDADGYLHKTLLVDLLKIQDPDDLNRDGSRLFTFPFQTIEGLVVINRTTIGIVNDNNYPFGRARGSNGIQIDNNEFILLEIEPLW